MIRQVGSVIGRRLRPLVTVMFVLFGLMAGNSVYLLAIRMLQQVSDAALQDGFYQSMFLAHLIGGLCLIPIFLSYVPAHYRRAHLRPNRLAVRMGIGVAVTGAVLLVSGVLLTRGIPGLEIRSGLIRSVLYWSHLLTFAGVVWLFVLHRLAGSPIRWRRGAWLLAGSLILIVGGAWVYRTTGMATESVIEFEPSLVKLRADELLKPEVLMQDEECSECHADTHERWSASAHRFSSFNNPAYRFSVEKTREVLLQRDGNMSASRFCAGCHDLVPLFTGAFDQPGFSRNHPTASAGVNCLGCHAITSVDSNRGNADFTMQAPSRYPFADSDSAAGRWLNRLLIRANPQLHKRSLLKPVHETAEFCGACHKVHLPKALNAYRWLRGQNHYDSYLLSGVSGHGATSFYYPDKPEPDCNGCHMPLRPSSDFGAFTATGDEGTLSETQVHDHFFPGANTALTPFMALPNWPNEAHRELLEGSVSLDIFGLKAGGQVTGELLAPVDDAVVLTTGETYLMELVVRTRTLGHWLTQGTADSNQLWLEVEVADADGMIGHSGWIERASGKVDPWAHRVNSYVIDAKGERIDRRNTEDIYTTLYNHQIPPGAADVVHYRFTVPDTVSGSLKISAKLNYRKFDTQFVRIFQEDPAAVNDLPVVVLGEDEVAMAVAHEMATRQPAVDASWQRWNDYGIGLLRKPGLGELRQAEAAFQRVADLGVWHGDANLARVYLREGRLDDAAMVLTRALGRGRIDFPWVLVWLRAQVDFQNGYLDEAIAGYRQILNTEFEEARRRGFDFSLDYRVWDELAQALLERAKIRRSGMSDSGWLSEAEEAYLKALALDPERASSHYGLAQVYSAMSRQAEAAKHAALHERYRIDDTAAGRAVSVARARDPAANHAANDVVIYELSNVPPGLPLVGESVPSESQPDATTPTITRPMPIQEP